MTRAIESGQPPAPTPRLKITSLLGGGHEIRVSYADMEGLSLRALAAAISHLTIGGERIKPENINPPIEKPHQRRWVIPITNGDTE